MSSHHLSLSLSRELWQEMLAAALPVKLAGEQLDLAVAARSAVKSIGVRQRVAGLLESRGPESRLVKARGRASELWHNRKPGIYRRLNQVMRVEGEWLVELDDLGTNLRYGKQEIGADAYVKATANGTIFLMKENLEFPFRIERRIGASVSLKDIKYDKGHRAVIGSVEDLGLYIGDNMLFQLLSRLAEYGLEQQLPRVNPVPILKRDQVDEMVGPMGGPLKMQMGVEDLELEITEDDLTLKVRFGFTRAQLTDREAEEQPY